MVNGAELDALLDSLQPAMPVEASSAEIERLLDALEPEAPEVAVVEASLVVGIVEASKRDWRAAAFVLERRWPERWALRAPP